MPAWILLYLSSTCQRNIDVDTSFVGFNMLPIVSSKFQKDVGVGAKPLFVPCTSTMFSPEIDYTCLPTYLFFDNS